MSRSGFIFFLNALAILREKDVIRAKVSHFDFIPYADVIFFGFWFAAPKRKRPRPVKYDDEHPTNFPARNSSILSIAKVDVDQPARIDSSPNLENPGSAAENGGVSHDLLSNQAAPAMTQAQLQEAVKLENHPISDSKPTTEGSECRDLSGLIEETRSPKKESTPSLRLDDDCESLTANKA